MLELEFWTLVVALITMAIVIVAEFTKSRGLRDQEFERELARLCSLVDRLKFRAAKGRDKEDYDGILVINFSIGGLLDITKSRDIKTIEKLREVFGNKGEFRQFTHTEHYLLSLCNLMKWVDKRWLKWDRYKYAQKVVASLGREEVILLSFFCLIRFPLVSTAKDMKNYVEKYGMLHLLHSEIEIDREGKGMDFRKHYEKSAFAEGGSGQ